MNSLINGINGFKPPTLQGLQIPQYTSPAGLDVPKGSSLGTGQTRFAGFSPDSNPFQNIPAPIVPHGVGDKAFNQFANTGVGMKLNLMG